MNNQALTQNRSKIFNLFIHILKAGLIVGTLDILAAFVNSYLSADINPERVLKFIASGMYGRAAFIGGIEMAALGLLFHLLIATFWAALFFLMYPAICRISKNRVINGLGYGILIWLVMNLVVLPYSNTPKGTFNATQVIIGVLILVVCVGLPLSFMAHRHYHKMQQPT
ncbi:MAG: hypothetical protein SFU99_11885 [Saprospiraceae bacterium]|nr:hypothetical protein [Saprospiraceae bacterium]